jgi:F-type H+-transporting ATPase subunit b
MDTFRQLGGLLLGAVPTGVLLLLMYLAYHVLVHKPLERVLAERRARTEGAIEQARTDIALAEMKANEYEERLRDAKIAVFKAMDTRRQQAQQARAAAVAQARARAEAQVKDAKAGVERDVVAAKSTLQGEAERLANEIIRTILQPAGTGQAPAAGR